MTTYLNETSPDSSSDHFYHVLPLNCSGDDSDVSCVFYTSPSGKSVYPISSLPPGKLIPRAHSQHDALRKRRLSVYFTPSLAEAIAECAAALNLAESSFIDFVMSSFIQQLNASGGIRSFKHSTYSDALGRRYLTVQIPSVFPLTTLVRPSYVGDTVPFYTVSSKMAHAILNKGSSTEVTSEVTSTEITPVEEK